MNWFAVRVFLLCAVGLAAVVSFAFMMATAEYGTRRECGCFAALTAALVASAALLLGSVA